MGIVLEEREQAEEYEISPLVAHYGHPEDETNRVALCLRPILGVPAFEPFVRCEDCEFLAAIYQETGDLPLLPARP